MGISRSISSLSARTSSNSRSDQLCHRKDQDFGTADSRDDREGKMILPIHKHIAQENRELRAEVERLKTELLTRRIGRPIKDARKGRRSRISVDISAPTKALIVKRTKETGRTLAREAEIMIERYFELKENNKVANSGDGSGKIENS